MSLNMRIDIYLFFFYVVFSGTRWIVQLIFVTASCEAFTSFVKSSKLPSVPIVLCVTGTAYPNLYKYLLSLNLFICKAFSFTLCSMSHVVAVIFDKIVHPICVKRFLDVNVLFAKAKECGYRDCYWIWSNLPVMQRFLRQKWQNHNFGDTAFLGSLARYSSIYACDLFWCNKASK